MNIYFNSITDDHHFDLHQIDLTINSWAVFNLEIIEREGQFPRATVLIQNPYRGLLNPDYPSRAAITVQTDQQIKLLFIGQIIGVPSHIDGEMMEIILIAKPTDSHDQIKLLRQSLQQAPYWDNLFAAKDCQSDLSELLDGRQALPYWSRFDQPLKLSNIFWGSKRYELGRNFFRDKLKFQSLGQPLSSVRVNLKMEWIQKYRGRTNISRLLNACFPQGLISTFTGKNLQAKWWKKDEVLGRTGYWIEQSCLTPVPTLSTGILQLYPAYSTDITLSPHDPLNKSGKPKSIKLKRSWYRAQLILGWMYRQKRIEKVHFTLKNQLQIAPDNITQTRVLKINLQSFIDEKPAARQWQSDVLYQPGDCALIQDRLYQVVRAHLSGTKMSDDRAYWLEIVDDDVDRQAVQQASFFTTPRGHRAIQHALNIATAHLAASTRAVELSIQAPFEAVMHLTCDHSVKIIDKRLPGGKAWGKVIALRLISEGQSGRLWGELKLLSSIGFAVVNDQVNTENNTLTQEHYTELYCDNSYSDCNFGISQIQVPSVYNTITYDHNKMLGPSTGILYPEQLSAYDIVACVKILNGPAEQHDALIRNQYPVRHNLAAVLADHRTEIILRLKDLQPVSVLEHQIELSVNRAWTAPQQINLQAAQIH